MPLPGGTSLLVLVVGVLVAMGMGWYVHRDAIDNEVGRPWLWVALCCGTFLLGVWLYATADVPATGAIITANTGLVLYGFEREVVNEDDPGRRATGEPLYEE